MKFFNRFAVSLLASVLCASTLFAMPVDAKKTTKRRQPTQAELAAAAGQDCGNGCDREADKEDSVLVLLPFGEHSVQHPAVHDLCGAAD